MGGGGDDAESVYTALVDAIHNQGLSPWRADATKVVLLIGDGPAHDTDPDTGYTLNDVVHAANFSDVAGGSEGSVSIFTIAALPLGGYARETSPGVFKSAVDSFAAIAAATGGQSFTTASPDVVVPVVEEAVGSIGPSCR